jgi:hypothetical protein
MSTTTEDDERKPLRASSDPNVLTNDAGEATTPLHEAMTAAVEATEDDDGEDVDESSAGDDKDADKTVRPLQPGNIFARYASTPDARNAAEFTPKRFDSPGGNTTHPNQFGERLTGLNPLHDATSDVVQDQGAVRIVGGSSTTLDGNALRTVEAQLSEATRANFDTSALQAQAAAIREPVLSVRAAAPVLVPLMPLERTPTPVE